jgi:hypothetical protein
MVDEIHTGIAPNPVHPTTNVASQDWSKPAEPKTEPKAAKVDHLGLIAELVRDLHNITPSGAESVRDKILQHIADIKDPKAYDERMAAEKKAADEAAAASKRAKEDAAKSEKVA